MQALNIPLTTVSTNPSTNAGSSSSRTNPSPLAPVVSSTGFSYPTIWSFPPFFTLQPNPQTFAHQLTLWNALVLQYSKHHRVFSLDLSADLAGMGDVFENKALHRKLSPASIRQLITYMEKEGTVSPEPPKQQSAYLVYWRKPEEWGGIIYDWITENGMTGSVMTFYELVEGDMAHLTEFYELPAPLLRRALDTLVKKGKAQVIKGEAEGVKFF